jgi:hypothetical protein
MARVSVNMDPMAASIGGAVTNAQSNDGFGCDPRTRRREVNVNSMAVTAMSYTYGLITRSQNFGIYAFTQICRDSLCWVTGPYVW